MRRPVSSMIQERVKQIHYSSPDFKPEPEITSVYNVCPMCGIVTKLDSMQKTEEQQIDILIDSDSNNCTTCNNVKHLHPHIHEWVNLLFDNLNFLESTRTTPVPPPEKLPSETESEKIIDAELVNEENN